LIFANAIMSLRVSFWLVIAIMASTSASSSTTPPAKQSAELPEATRLSCSLIENVSFVHLVTVSGEQRVVNYMTREWVSLPRDGSWSKVDIDGFAAFADEMGNHEDVIAEECMTKNLVATNVGKELVLHADRGEKTGYAKVKDAFQRFMAVTIVWPYSLLRCTVSAEAWLLHWPRVGCRLVWSVTALYDALKLKVYSGKGIKWAHDCMPRWKEHVSSHDIDPVWHCFESSYTKSAESATSLIPFNFLPNWGVSTVAYFVLLLHWSSLPPRRGGMKGIVPLACRAYLEGFLVSCCARRPITIGIEFCESWSSPWPSPSQTPHVTLSVGADSRVDFTPWVQYQACASVALLSRKWFNVFNASLSAHDNKLDLIDVLALAIRDESAESCFRQLVHQTASECETTLIAASETASVESETMVRMTVHAVNDMLSDRRKLNAELVRRIQANVDASKNEFVFFVATDKFNIGGQHLANTVISFGAYATIAAPQVPDRYGGETNSSNHHETNQQKTQKKTLTLLYR
jgi:hypothetical protein